MTASDDLSFAPLNIFSLDDAFLATIQAAPNDDTPRLVYADWLEERGRADQAEYLRIVHALTILPDDDRKQRKLVKKLLALAESVDESWRKAAGQRFDLLIDGWLGGAMFVFMRAVRWLTGGHPWGNLEANDESRSVTLLRSVLREEAEAHASQMDKQRFNKKRAAKPFYRIVPTGSQLAISSTNVASC